jgi:hypothetical protein
MTARYRGVYQEAKERKPFGPREWALRTCDDPSRVFRFLLKLADGEPPDRPCSSPRSRTGPWAIRSQPAAATSGASSRSRRTSSTSSSRAASMRCSRSSLCEVGSTNASQVCPRRGVLKVSRPFARGPCGKRPGWSFSDTMGKLIDTEIVLALLHARTQRGRWPERPERTIGPRARLPEGSYSSVRARIEKETRQT